MSRSIRKSAVFFLFSALSACGGGGGSNDFSSSIAGTWSGQMVQASGVSCSDGSFFGAGLGTPTRTLTISISGGDAFGDAVTISAEGCEFGGLRVSETDVTVDATSAACGDSLTLTEISGDSAKLFVDSGSPEPAPNGETGCVIAEAGDIQKLE